MHSYIYFKKRIKGLYHKYCDYFCKKFWEFEMFLVLPEMSAFRVGVVAQDSEEEQKQQSWCMEAFNIMIRYTQDVPWTRVSKTYQTNSLSFAESPQPQIIDLSLVNSSMTLQGASWTFRARRAQSTLDANGNWLHPCALNKSKVYCFHTFFCHFVQL